MSDLKSNLIFHHPVKRSEKPPRNVQWTILGITMINTMLLFIVVFVAIVTVDSIDMTLKNVQFRCVNVTDGS